MPFSKWTLEPVYVSRTPPWQAHQAGKTGPSSSTANGVTPPTKCSTKPNPTSVLLPPFVLSLPSPPTSRQTSQQQSQPDSAPPLGNCNEPVLIKIQCRTMVSVIRQMAALLGASDQLFAEITEEIRRLVDRSVSLRGRVVKLSGTVDRANAHMRQSAPHIASLLHELDLQQQSSPPRHHWASSRPLEGNLFCPETRPLSVRTVYARAHAPGDLRLASSYYSGLGYPSPFVTMLRLRRPQGQSHQILEGHGHQHHTRRSAPMSSTILSCQCSCGQCHQETRQPTSDPTCNHHTEPPPPHSNRNSSPSSLVTWSSVATSSAFESSIAAAATSGPPQQPKQSHLKRRSTGLLSSFSSADYEEEASTDPKTKIDDFFRANNVIIESSGADHQPSTTLPPTKCTCSCATSIAESRRSRPPLTSDDLTSLYSQVDSQITSTTGATSSEALSTSEAATGRGGHFVNGAPSGSTATMHHPEGYSYYSWWWSDDEHRRWSSAMTSPLKPAKTDEMSIWIRENIETRRPESVVFKSASDVPDHVLLERALSPPCSMHSIQLRPKKAEEVQSDIEGSGSSTLPRLKRRWSLFPVRRKRHQSTPAVPAVSSPTTSPTKSHETAAQFFNRFSRNRQSLPPENRLNNRKNNKSSLEREAMTDIEAAEDTVDEDGSSPREIVLMSPEERVKLLAGQFSAPVLVPIDISGRQFQRMSNARRSLIHSDFHIPRRHIPGGRSRSKSPIKNSSRHEVSPYALSGKLPDHHTRRPVAERGCQTEEADNTRTNGSTGTNRSPKAGNGNRYQVAVEVHRNAEQQHDRGPTATTDGRPFDEEDEDYVMLLRKIPGAHRGLRGYQHRKTMDDCTTSSNASTSDVGWRGLRTEDNQSHHPVRNNTPTNQTITLRYRAYDPAAKNRRQNGGRSSSGNWSAATSDLLGQSSTSTSSSPLHGASMKVQTSSTEPNDHHPAATAAAKKFIKALRGNKDAETTATANDEAESVYSVDNDGYFTSMHTDSGLFFGHTATVATAPVEHRSLTLGARGKRGVGLRMPFERIQEESGSMKSSGNLVESSTSPGKSNNNNNFGGSNESINSILSNSDATSVALDGVPVDDTASSMADFDCSVSHCSHQFTNGGGGRHHRLGHRAHHRAEVEEKRRLTAAAIRMMQARQQQQQQQRVRTVSGTYDDEEDEETLRSSSSSTLHTMDEEVTEGLASRNRIKKSPSYRMQNYTGTYSNIRSAATLGSKVEPAPTATTTLQRSSNSLRRQISNLTESSSASSSCRKLPPPPPPPRVSSMLQTLQQYRSDDERHSKVATQCRTSGGQSEADAEEDEDLDSLVSGSLRHSLAEGQGSVRGGCRTESLASSSQAYRYLSRPTSGSEETNSEYLRNQTERRRRLFLDVVDSARSYPPLSYIPSYDQQTDTATSISLASSSVFDEDEEDGEVARSKVMESEDTLCTTPTAASSRTITPVGDDPGTSSAAAAPPPNAANNFGTLERKQLENRHLSSPLPPPKLASFVRVNETTEQQLNPQQGSASPKSTPPKTTPEASSPPKPKPRNSLHFSTPPNLESFSKETKVSPPKETPPTPQPSPKSPKSVTISLPASSPRSSPAQARTTTTTTTSTESTSSSSGSSSAQVSPTSGSTTTTTRRLTTEDLFIILHNQKKKLNIKTEPEIFTSTRSPPASTTRSPTSPPTPLSPRSPSSTATANSNPTYGQITPVSPNSAASLKRRSWTGQSDALLSSPGSRSSQQQQPANGTLGSNAARQRQSLALDRLGPLRPTTLSDFKRLLANVRPNGTGPGTSPVGSSTTSSVSGTPVSSTYSALQQILKGSQPSGGNTISTSSGVGSSLTSPTSPTTSSLSPLSSSSFASSAPTSPFPSPARKPITPSPVLSPLSPSVPNGTTSMNSFIKKFSKSKFLNNNHNHTATSGDRSRSAVARLEVLSSTTCPPIPEDPVDGGGLPEVAGREDTTPSQNSDCKRECSDALKETDSMKHNCTSTWV